MGTILTTLFEDAESDPLWQTAGLLANAPPRPAKGYATVPLAWLARVLPVVRTTTHLVVAMLIYRECLRAAEQDGALSNGELGNDSASAATPSIGPWLGCARAGMIAIEGQKRALSAGDLALVPVAS